MKDDDKLTIMIILGIIASLVILTTMIRFGSQSLIDTFGLNLILWIYSLIVAIFIDVILFFILGMSGVCDDPGHIQ